MGIIREGDEESMAHVKMNHSVRSQKGQLVVEFVLLLSLGVGAALLVGKLLKDNQFAQNLFGRPWATLSGMVECGSWDGCRSGYHPAARSRILSYRPTE